MKILAIDQATKISGWCTISGNKLLDYGKIVVDEKHDTFVRMYEMQQRIKELITKHRPDIVVFEGVQYQHNQAVFLCLAQLQGLLISLLFDMGVEFRICDVGTWKNWCGIKSRKREEQKAEQIQYVLDTYNIEVSTDIADAIGMGVWASRNVKMKS